MLFKYYLKHSGDSDEDIIDIKCENETILQFSCEVKGANTHYTFFSKINKNNIAEDWMYYHEIDNVRTRFFNLHTKKIYESAFYPGHIMFDRVGSIFTSKDEKNHITFYEFLDPEDNLVFINKLQCPINVVYDNEVGKVRWCYNIFQYCNVIDSEIYPMIQLKKIGNRMCLVDE